MVEVESAPQDFGVWLMPGEQTGFQKNWGGLSAIGFMLVACTLVGGGLGYAGDSRWGTTPWLMVVGLILGMAAGLVYVFDKAWTRQGPGA